MCQSNDHIFLYIISRANSVLYSKNQNCVYDLLSCQDNKEVCLLDFARLDLSPRHDIQPCHELCKGFITQLTISIEFTMSIQKTTPTIAVGDAEVPVALYFEVIDLYEQEQHADNIVFKIISTQSIADVLSFRQIVSQIIYNQEVMQEGSPHTALNSVKRVSFGRDTIKKRRLSRIRKLNEL